MIINTYLLALGAYLVGSFPTGYFVAKLAGIADIRHYGSGNIGATNVARMLGVHFFFLVLLIDALKAYCYVRYAQSISLSDKYLCLIAFLLLVGNIFPIFLGFRGGKGVSTSVGIVAALMPGIFAYIFGIWLAVLALTNTIGVASVVGAFAMPFLACYFYGLAHVYAQLSIVFTISLLVTHRENIARVFQILFS